MIRLALVLALALVLELEAGAQTFPTPGPGHVPWVATAGGGGSGGAGTGVEARYPALASDPHVVARCSEPMDGPNGETQNFADGSGTFDNSLSPNDSECWGRGGNWQHSYYQTGHSQTIEPVTGWGSVGYASNQPSSSGDWWPAYKPSQLSADFGITAATICIRYYKQVSSNYATASDSCGGGTNRNKFAELNANNNPFQLEEEPLQGGGCGVATDSTRGLMACWDSGPGIDPLGCPRLSPIPRIGDAISRPMRVEMCYETTNIATGANAVVRSYVTTAGSSPPYYTTTGVRATPTATVGSPTKDETWAANLDHTGTGESWSGYFMFVVWDDVNNHTIGAACEIEGGC